MAEMTDDEALSVIGRMEAERRSWEQQNAALRHIAGVITTYQRARVGLPALTEAQRVHAEAMAQMAAEARDAETKWGQRVTEAKNQAEAAIAEAHGRQGQAEEAAVRAEKTLADKEAFVASRSAALDAEIKAKTAQLAALENDIGAFKRKHGLA